MSSSVQMRTSEVIFDAVAMGVSIGLDEVEERIKANDPLIQTSVGVGAVLSDRVMQCLMRVFDLDDYQDPTSNTPVGQWVPLTPEAEEEATIQPGDRDYEEPDKEGKD